MNRVFGPDREAAICRELTKKFETVLRGKFQDLQLMLEADPHQTRGEFVVLVSGLENTEPLVDGLDLALALKEHLPASQAAKVAAKLTGASRRDLYKALEDS